jgi:hypothetical protein
VPPEFADPIGPFEVQEAEDVPEFGPSCRREGSEASLEPRLYLIEVHDVEANPSGRL